MTDTATLTTDIMLAASKAGHRLFRNNQGLAIHKSATGKSYAVEYGIPRGKGGGDLLGWCRGTARFASIEIKVGRDKSSPAQLKWALAVRAAGGVAGEARSVEDALAILESGAS